MRPDVARKRERWKAHQGRIDPSRLVFIDETWVKTNMAPLRGWGPRGKRLKAYAPFGHWKTLTFIAALRCDRIDAPWIIDGPINGELFGLYVEKVLVPTCSAAILSSSTISAAISERLFAKRSERQAPSCFSCPNTHPT